MQTLVPLNAHRHRHLKLHQQPGWRFARVFSQCALVLDEFARAALHYPIAFVRQAEGWLPVALLSRGGEGNAYVGPDGRWRAPYIPLSVRTHPFLLARAPGGELPVVCIDDRSELLSSDHGAPLFDMHGEQAPALARVLDSLGEIDALRRATEAFCQSLAVLNLLAPLPSLSGCWMVDEQALARLPDASLCVLRAKGWLLPLYAHRISLARLDRLPAAAGGSAGRNT